MQSVPAPPPRVLLQLSAAVVVAGTVMAIIGAFQTGSTRDESYHVMRMDNFLHHGVYALDTAVAGEDATGAGENTVVYAPVTSLLLHTGSVLLGQEGWGSVAATPGAYDSRHLGVVLIGLIGTAAAAGIVRILLKSWQWALVSAAALLALPMWTGHLMFNIKDVPVATGYTLVTLALVGMVCGGRRLRWARIAGLFAGVALMVGTRPAMVSAVLAGVVVLLGGLLIGRRRQAARAACLEIAVAGIASYGVLLATYPKVFAHPGTLVQSGEKSASFKGGEDAHLGYVPFYVLTQTPLLLLAFFALGVLVAARLVWKDRDVPVLLVGTQLCALPLVAIVGHSDLYNGLRQLLFAAPAWAVLTTLGMAVLVRARPRLVAAVASLALVAPLVDQVLEFPYQYTYYNAAYDASVGDHRPYKAQTDYWRASAPELLKKIPTDGQVICGPNRSPNPGPGRSTVVGRYSTGPGRSIDCRLDPLGPLASYWKADELPLGDDLSPSDFYAVIDNDYPLPNNCERLDDVTRPRHGRTITMLYLARCDSGPLPALTSQPVRFAPGDGHQVTAGFWRYLPRGWVKQSNSGGVDAAEPNPVVAFTAPPTCRTVACLVDVAGIGTYEADLTVNGKRAQRGFNHGHLLVRLPAGATDVRLTFGGDVEQLRLRSIRIAPRTIGTP